MLVYQQHIVNAFPIVRRLYVYARSAPVDCYGPSGRRTSSHNRETKAGQRAFVTARDNISNCALTLKSSEVVGIGVAIYII